MENTNIISYAVLAYRRMSNMDYDEKTFEAILVGIMKEYTLDEVNKEINKREIR